jgi:hypothetical protein
MQCKRRGFLATCLAALLPWGGKGDVTEPRLLFVAPEGLGVARRLVAAGPDGVLCRLKGELGVEPCDPVYRDSATGTVMVDPRRPLPHPRPLIPGP